MITILNDTNYYPAFGLSKMQKIIEDTNCRRREAPAKMADAARKMAAVAGKHEKEGDWAIAGGIAQGIGGVGAGIAAAADAQRRNAEIRQRNAQRDAEAARLNQLANQVGAASLDQINVDTALSGWRVSVDEDTRSLFKKLRISVGRISSFHDADITFSMTDVSYPYKVDGYLKMITHSAKGKLLGEKIIPIPVWDKEASSAVLNCKIPFDFADTGYGGLGGSTDVKIEFRPYVLWKISTDPNLPNYTRAFRTEDIENGSAKDAFVNYWHQLEETKAKAEKEKKKKNRIIAVAVIALLALTTVLIVSSATKRNQEKAFAEGSLLIRYASRDYYSQATGYFKDLPASYDEKIVEVCMKQAREAFFKASYSTEYEHILFLLNTARSYAANNATILAEISDMEIQTRIKMNDSAVKQTIIRAYRRGEISADEVTEYAEMMYDFQPDRGSSELADIIVPMLEELLPENTDFQQLIDRYNVVEQEYQAAVALFDTKNFEACLDFFSEHRDYKNCAYYLSICEGVSYWCGTWKDKDGNTFRIEIDDSMDVYYRDYSSNAGKFYYPQQVYVRIYDNGEDVTAYLMNHGKHYVIRENNFKHIDGTVDIKYQLTGVQSFQTYHFVSGRSVEDSCSILKYDADIGNANRVWQRYYYKAPD